MNRADRDLARKFAGYTDLEPLTAPPPRRRTPRRSPVQPPLVLAVPAPDPRRLTDADRLAALDAAAVDPALPDYAHRGLSIMWARADAYGVYRGSASAIGVALGRSKARGTEIARLLSERAYAVRRPDGYLQLQNPSVEGLNARPASAHAQRVTPTRPVSDTHSPSMRYPHPLRGGGGRAPSSKTGAPRSPRAPLSRPTCTRCDTTGWIPTGERTSDRCPDCNPERRP